MTKAKKSIGNIVVLGAGFAGLRAIQDLSKDFGHPGYKLVLIEKNDTHLYRADLYEVATAFNKEISESCLSKLKSTVATPLTELLDPKRVSLIYGEVIKIDRDKKKVHLASGKEISYAILVVALGSVTNFFGVKGLEKHSLPMKTIQDALRINCHLDQFFNDAWQKKRKKKIVINIGGGGASGVETAAELVGSLHKLCKKYDFDRSKVVLRLIEAGDDLAAFDQKGTQIILNRFKKLGVEVLLKTRISELSKTQVTVLDPKNKPKTLESDILIWTGGVSVNPVVVDSMGKKERRGAVEVNQYLQTIANPEIFAAGDNAYFPDPSNIEMRLPMLASVAYQQGSVIAQNIINFVKGEKLLPFKPKSELYVIPIGGKYALWRVGRILFRGRLVWYFRRLLTLKYEMSILPFTEAWAKWRHGSDIFEDND